MIDLGKAIYNIDSTAVWCTTDGTLATIKWLNGTTPIPSNIIQAEITRLNSLEPMRLLRQERDRLLLSTDWAGNSDVTMPQNIAIYRQALRDLPQDIAAGKIVAPTIDNNGNLVFNFPTI